MKKLYCFLFIFTLSLLLFSGCDKDERQPEEELYGVFNVDHFTSQEIDVAEFDKKLIRVNNATIVDISCNLNTSFAVIQLYDYGEEIDKAYYDEVSGEMHHDYYLPHFNAILYTNIPYYKQPYKTGDKISFEGFIFYRTLPSQQQFIQTPLGDLFAFYCFDVSPAKIITD